MQYGFALVGWAILWSAACPAGAADPTGLPAFPGAEGFGATTPGGRGGRVIAVTTLADYDPADEEPIAGSFRAACLAEGPRIVVFRVAGIIGLKAPVFVREGALTIAGQSAPGDGVCLRGNSLVLHGVRDVVVRHLRSRPGDGRASLDDTTAPRRSDRAGRGNDAIQVIRCRRVVLDHCSTSWGVDENIEVLGSQDVTVQWCLVAEGLHRSTQYKGPHSRGLMVAYGSSDVTLHHNLIAHNVDRNPLLPAEGDEPYLVDVVNNVIYNWWYRAACASPKTNDNGSINFVGNHAVAGPNSWKRHSLICGVDARVWAKDNLGPYRIHDGMDEYAAVRWNSGETGDRPDLHAEKRFAAPPVTTQPCLEASARVLREAGATIPRRDLADLRVVDTVKLRQGRIIDHPSQVGGWPALRAAAAPPDADGDGMPDAWERSRGLDAKDPSDAAGDRDGDGYTNVEEWLNAIGRGTRHPTAAAETVAGAGTDRSPYAIAYVPPDRIVLDGLADDWDDVACLPLPRMNRRRTRFRLAWNERGLYGTVAVDDELLRLIAATPYWGDCVEMFIDKAYTRKDVRSRRGRDDNAQYFLVPAESLVSGPCHAIEMRGRSHVPAEGLEAAWSRTDRGYILEFRFTPEELTPGRLEKGARFGFDLDQRDDANRTMSFYAEDEPRWRSPKSWAALVLTR